MKSQFVTYEIAKSLKELEFDEPCLAGYENFDCGIQLHIPAGKHSSVSKIPFYKNYSKQNTHIVKAPLWQQVIDWFREKYEVDINIYIKKVSNGNIAIYVFSIFFIAEHPDKKWYNESLDYDSQKENVDFVRYSTAREQAILKAIELVSKK